MNSDKFKIEVNGVEFEASPGQMLIEVTDAADIYIPRFCYHSKLSVAANCRMCLIEVENSPKPLPACATPVTDGMKVFTKSAKAISAQKSVMEFLLINHPLDCPICDQGGECELQDIAMGYGRGISRYAEGKRVVQDEDLGPLVSTDMTRCIQCTRCVRFGQEIAGIQELGVIGRGELMEISTYIENSVDHELSGNIIDLCPVGALNNKPYRFSARAWEMVQHPTVAPHDCLGSNLYAHVMQGVLKRIVPRVNESINETWISDRDRFSFEGMYASDRLETPMVRIDGELTPCSWQEGLRVAAESLKRVRGDLGAWVSPNVTTEEAYLTGRIVRHLGSDNLDHRLRRRDFRQQDADPIFPWLGMSIDDVEQLGGLLLVGSNLRKEVPMLAHRVRKAAVAGARVAVINSEQYEYLFPLQHDLKVGNLIDELACLVKAAADDKVKSLSSGVKSLVKASKSQPVHHDVVAVLRDAKPSGILLGHISMRHPRFAELRFLAAELARLTGARLGYVSEGANSSGASLAGVLPHRGIGGSPVARLGASIGQMVADPPRSLMLVDVEPESDCALGADALAALDRAEFVLALSPFLGDGLQQVADVVLPIGTFAETSGTYVNAAGDWQSFAAVARPVGECRPGWKVLRVLGNLIDLPDCDYDTAEAVRDELRQLLNDIGPTKLAPDNSIPLEKAPDVVVSDESDALDVPIYSTDSLVRRSRSLQLTRDGRPMVSEKRKIA